MKDLVGRIFNRLTVTEDFGIIKGRRHVKCLCSCGNVLNIKLQSLQAKDTQSCGCLRVKHGLSGTRVYDVWAGMNRRCNDESDKDYCLRGITVCDEWKNSVVNFVRDMGHPPKNMSIDRIDNDKGYSLENCRWANKSMQSLNRRDFGKVKYRGVSFNKLAGKYEAKLQVNGNRKFLGRYETPLEASIVYEEYRTLILECH